MENATGLVAVYDSDNFGETSSVSANLLRRKTVRLGNLYVVPAVDAGDEIYLAIENCGATETLYVFPRYDTVTAVWETTLPCRTGPIVQGAFQRVVIGDIDGSGWCDGIHCERTMKAKSVT